MGKNNNSVKGAINPITNKRPGGPNGSDEAKKPSSRVSSSIILKRPGRPNGSGEAKKPSGRASVVDLIGLARLRDILTKLLTRLFSRSPTNLTGQTKLKSSPVRLTSTQTGLRGIMQLIFLVLSIINVTILYLWRTCGIILTTTSS